MTIETRSFTSKPGVDAKLTMIKPAESRILPFADQERVLTTADFIIPNRLPESQKRAVQLVLKATADNDRDILPDEISARFPKAKSLRNARTSFASSISRANPTLRREKGWEIRSVGSIRTHGKNIKSRNGTWKPFKVEVSDANAARLIAKNAERTEEKSLKDLRVEITRTILKSVVNKELEKLPKSPVKFAWQLMHGKYVEVPKMEPEETDSFRKLILESMMDTLIDIGGRATNPDNLSPEEHEIFINMKIILRPGNTFKELIDFVSEHFSLRDKKPFS